MSVRRLGPSDLDAYAALRGTALRDHPEAFGSSVEEDAALTREQRLSRISDPNALFGAFVGGGLVGIAGLAPDRGEKRRHRATLVSVYLAPAHRRSGLAKTLVAAVIAHARGRALVVEAAVGADNAPARALYASLGFTEFGRQRRAIRVGEHFHDEILIALDLDR